MGQRVHVHPGQGVSEKQFQDLMVRHALDAVLLKCLPEAAPVSRMLVHAKFSKSFCSFTTYSTGNPSSLRVASPVMPSMSPDGGQSS